MHKLEKIIKTLYPYALILLFSVFGTFILFFNGIPLGDDFYYHLPNILDLSKTLENGSYSVVSSYLASGLGVANRLFYSPLPHLTVAVLTNFFNLFGLSMLNAYKTVVFLSVFISGIFAYHMCLNFTGHRLAALLGAAVYTLYPYRLFDAFCRFAFAETFAFIFLPLFFGSLLVITKENYKPRLLDFLNLAVGGAGLFVSHNITAFYAYIFGVFLLVLRIKPIIKQLKNPRFLAYAASAAVLLVGMASISLFSQLELMNTGLYNVSDSVRMWTDANTVAARAGEQFAYSGFINPLYLARFGEKYDLLHTFLYMVILIALMSACAVGDYFLDKLQILGKYYRLFTFACYIVVILLLGRIEFLFAGLVFYLLYIAICKGLKDEPAQDFSGFIKNTYFLFLIISCMAVMLLMEFPFFWQIMPSLLRNIQFPWRLWAFIQLFASILVAFLVEKMPFKKLVCLTFAILIAITMAMNEPLLEKRLTAEIPFNNHWKYEQALDDSILKSGAALGFNKEYCPQVFFDKTYKSEYANSLYKKVAARLPYDFEKYANYSIDPAVLSGEANITINSRLAPVYDMVITVNEESLIQLPLIYYPGYLIYAEGTNGTVALDALNVDGLVAFNLKSGKYLVKTQYEGTTIRKISIIYSLISVFIVLALYSMIAASRMINRRSESDAQTQNAQTSGKT